MFFQALTYGLVIYFDNKNHIDHQFHTFSSRNPAKNSFVLYLILTTREKVPSHISTCLQFDMLILLRYIEGLLLKFLTLWECYCSRIYGTLHIPALPRWFAIGSFLAVFSTCRTSHFLLHDFDILGSSSCQKRKKPRYKWTKAWFSRVQRFWCG